MSEFFSALLVYWNGFSNVSQGVIGRIGYALTGTEISVTTTHWIFYGGLILISVILMRARSLKLRNQIETRQRFDI